MSDEEIGVATAAYIADESANPFTVKSGHTVVGAKAIEEHPQAKELPADKATTSGLRRAIVMPALILSFPMHG